MGVESASVKDVREGVHDIGVKLGLHHFDVHGRKYEVMVKGFKGGSVD